MTTRGWLALAALSVGVFVAVPAAVLVAAVVWAGYVVLGKLEGVY